MISRQNVASEWLTRGEIRASSGRSRQASGLDAEGARVRCSMEKEKAIKRDGRRRERECVCEYSASRCRKHKGFRQLECALCSLMRESANEIAPPPWLVRHSRAAAAAAANCSSGGAKQTPLSSRPLVSFPASSSTLAYCVSIVPPFSLAAAFLLPPPPT